MEQIDKEPDLETIRSYLVSKMNHLLEMDKAYV